ncbi:Proline dehydrogenase 2, mitochondrial [Linum grandiflorum]
MATTSAATKFLLRHGGTPAVVRHLNSSPSSFSAATPPLTLTTNVDPATTITTTNPPPPPPPPSTSILQLDDHRELYGSVPLRKLIHASAVLHASAAEAVVDVGTKVLNSRLMDVEAVRGLVYGVVRRTFYEHFCAGETAAAAREKVKQLNECGLRAMLDFAVEYTPDNEACDRNLEGFLETVDSAASLPPSSVSFVAVKMTAICPLPLLERISDLLRWQQRLSASALKFHLPWKQSSCSLPIFSESSPLYHTLTQPPQLTPQEEQDLQLSHNRLNILCQRCSQSNNLSITIDAEDTKLQPAIDYFTYSAAANFNTKDTPLVYNTIQAYLKDAKERLLMATKAADNIGLAMGFKLVRGAYMSSERLLASKLGFESPVHDTIRETHECYNDCARFMIDRIGNCSDGLVLATHNVESGRLAAMRAREVGIMGKDEKRLEFAQLYGMGESLSMGLKNAGFRVSKYMPFGPIDIVMPYLVRRAEENRGMLSASSLDRDLIRKELKRRLKGAILG